MSLAPELPSEIPWQSRDSTLKPKQLNHTDFCGISKPGHASQLVASYTIVSEGLRPDNSSPKCKNSPGMGPGSSPCMLLIGTKTWTVITVVVA